MEHTLTRKTLLKTSLAEAWQFFSVPANLARITPASMNFVVITEDLPAEIHEGLIIDYTIRPLLNVKMKWRTLISSVERGKMFVDEQIRGPYSKWHHTHTFDESDDGIIMNDVVRYKLPFGMAGNYLGLRLVNKELKNIFDYRQQVIDSLFNKS